MKKKQEILHKTSPLPIDPCFGASYVTEFVIKGIEEADKPLFAKLNMYKVFDNLSYPLPDGKRGFDKIPDTNSPCFPPKITEEGVVYYHNRYVGGAYKEYDGYSFSLNGEEDVVSRLSKYSFSYSQTTPKKTPPIKRARTFKGSFIYEMVYLYGTYASSKYTIDKFFDEYGFVYRGGSRILRVVINLQNKGMNF